MTLGALIRDLAVEQCSTKATGAERFERIPIDFVNLRILLFLGGLNHLLLPPRVLFLGTPNLYFLPPRGRGFPRFPFTDGFL
ncbi:hypothetical protein ES703_48181 [subsurface metagenome]